MHITTNFFTNILKTLSLTFCILALAAISFAQEERSPNKGFQAGNSYAISDIEQVNLQNQNLMLNIPLASLSPGRGTSPGYTVAMHYNSKLWDSHLVQKDNGNPDQSGNTRYTKEMLELSENGGWSLNANGYELIVINRQNLEEDAPCVPGGEYAFTRNGYSYKVQMKTPEGGVVTFRPYGTGTTFVDAYQDDYFSIDPTGLRHVYSLSESQIPDPAASCTYGTEPIITTGMNYYSDDGSGMRLFVPPGATGVAHWKLYLSDGRLVESAPEDESGVAQRVTDRNGNKIKWIPATVSGLSGVKIQNDVGKYIFISTYVNDENKVITEGFNGAPLETTINWGTTNVYHTYTTTTAFNAPNFEKHAIWGGEVITVDKITLPSQTGSLEYNFTYWGDTEPPAEGDYTDGWGELKSLTLPSQAKAEYAYSSIIGGTPQLLLSSGVLTRTLTYQKEYDGSSVTETEVTKYGPNAVTAPDGGRRSENAPASSNFPGYNCITHNPDGSISEKIWANNVATMVGGTYTNAYVKTEFTSIPDANGNPVQTAIKDYDYDKNGNVLEVREYDWVPYSTIPRLTSGSPPTGLPASGYLTLKRKTVNTYYNPTPIATDTSFSGNNYAEPTSPKLHNVIASSETRDGSGNPKSRTEFFYDDASSKGNLTETRAWDNTKGGYSAPLTTGNSISTFTTYDTYGNPLTKTDANGSVAQITYGAVNGYTGLYATQTIAAYGTTIARTATATYDFPTGLRLTTTDVDNGLTNATEYDALGRPTKAITAQGTALEFWTTTTYDDSARRVIVRSDLETKGDGKRVATQFYDQLGRMRLSKTLEDAATQSAANETDGIKVQTRYAYDNPTDPVNSNGTYSLTSNPYRATTSGGASGEETMGWSRSYSTKTGLHGEATTFSGAALPAPWGSNSASTGTVTTDSDTDRTLVTDQAGKKRISRTNVLGQLSDVWEVTPSDGSTVSVTFPGSAGTGVSAGYQTSYVYDTLGNLTTVNQGSQTRSFAYSSLSRLTSATNPELGSTPTNGTISYGYDSNGNLTAKSQLRSGTANVLTSYTYDALNRVLQRSYSTPNGTPTNYQATPTVDYTYDGQLHAKGKLTKVSSSVSTAEYMSFDVLGRVTRSKQTTDGIAYGDDTHPMTYAYNLSGALVEQQYPSGRVVKNTLDANGDLSEVESKKISAATYWTYADQFVYNPAGAVTSMRLGNGHWESTIFNSRLQPEHIKLGLTQGTGNLLQLDYSYGTTADNGNVQSQTITVPTIGAGTGFTAVQNYTYDSLNRLHDAAETIAGPQTWKQTFTYDRYGNRNFDEANTTTLTKTCGTSPNFTVCTPDRKKENPSVNTTNNRLNTSDDYSYDLAGNTIADANSQSYIYDGNNKMVQASNGGGPLGYYYYDGNGKRVKKIVPNGESTIFVYDALGKMVSEYSTVLAATPEVGYLTSDPLGSPRINTNENGAVTARHDYHPFGEEIFTSQRTSGGYGADEIRKKFTGYERDGETGLDFAQARMHANKLGRFFSPDPLFTSIKLIEPQSLNKYSYCLNNPYKYIDPTGLIWFYHDEGNIRTFRWYDEDDAKNAPKDWNIYTGSNYYVGENEAIFLGADGRSKKVSKEEGVLGQLDEFLRGPDSPLTKEEKEKLTHAFLKRVWDFHSSDIGAIAMIFGSTVGNWAESGYNSFASALGNAKATEMTEMAAFSGMLREALAGKGNFGVGVASAEQAEIVGRAWVGEGYTVASDGTTLLSKDGLRQFRPSSFKPQLGKNQANLEWRLKPDGQWQGNGHIDVINVNP